jgi:predicted enzyme related to lactoylglutathione lyase
MTRRITAPTGAPVWIELASSDLAASHSFYTQLLGWEVEPPSPEFGGYTNLRKDGVRIAGSMDKPEMQPGPDAWLVYMSSTDCAATCDAAAAAGAMVMVPAMDVLTLGRMAVMLDPTGAAVGAWESWEHTGFGFWDEPGAPSWFELHTRDYAGALEFYAKAFGWTFEVEPGSPAFEYSRMVIDGESLAGVMGAAEFLPEGVSSNWQIYFETADIDASVAKVQALGGSLIHPIDDSPYGRLAACLDSTGAMFKLRQQ